MRCTACDLSCNYVHPTGPQPARVLFIGEKPGQQEDRMRKVFQGDTGREMENTYFPLAGLEREEVRITNTVMCRLGGNNNKPKPHQIHACALNHLPQEVERTQPEVIVLMGASACSLVEGVEIDKEHGMPRWVEGNEYFGDWEGEVWIMYHPAVGLHNTGMMIHLLRDWERMGQGWDRLMMPPKRQAPVYQIVETAEELVTDLSDESYEYLPVDTEDDGPRLWSVQYSVRPGHGKVIMADRVDLLELFGAMVGWGRTGIMVHNALHDMDRMDEVGLGGFKYRDTMQEAFHLGYLPQGLKALAYRELGVRMRSWEDLVLPPSRGMVIQWLAQGMERESGRSETVEKRYKRPAKGLRRGQDEEGVIRGEDGSILGTRKQVDNEWFKSAKWVVEHAKNEEYDLWEQVEKRGFQERWGEEIGRAPIKSIANVDIQEAVRYAAQDADIEGQVGTLLEKRRQELMNGEWRVPEMDWDK